MAEPSQGTRRAVSVPTTRGNHRERQTESAGVAGRESTGIAGRESMGVAGQDGPRARQRNTPGAQTGADR